MAMRSKSARRWVWVRGPRLPERWEARRSRRGDGVSGGGALEGGGVDGGCFERAAARVARGMVGGEEIWEKVVDADDGKDGGGLLFGWIYAMWISFDSKTRRDADCLACPACWCCGVEQCVVLGPGRFWRNCEFRLRWVIDQ